MAIREAQTNVLDVTKGEDDISWKRIRSVRHLAAQTYKGSTFEHIEMKLYRNLEFQKTVCKTKPAPSTGGPLIPSDPEREAEAIRSKEGIPLLKSMVDDLLAISEKTGNRSKSAGQHD